MPECPASPPAVAASTGTSEDVEARSLDWHAASLIRDVGGIEGRRALNVWVALQPLVMHMQREARDAREAAARAEERVEAWAWFTDLLEAHMLKGQPIWDEVQKMRRDLRIAREVPRG